jgi:hypothetical protein
MTRFAALALIAACAGCAASSIDHIDASVPDADYDEDGGSTSAACNVGTTCGGTVVGTWKLTAACSYSPLNVCNSSTVTISQYPSYLLVFNADLSYLETSTGSFVASCTVPGGQGGSCSQYNTTSGASTLACTGTATQSCTCTETQPTTVNTGGTYSTNGSLISLGTATSEYCVTGNSLALQDTGDPTYYVYTRQ